MLTIVEISSTLGHRVMRRLLPLLALVVALVFTAGAGAKTHRQIELGLFGDPGPFASVTHQKTEVRHIFVNLREGRIVGKLMAGAGPVPMVALTTGAYGNPGTATPKGVARGKNDAFLFQLNAAIAAYPGSLVYVRPFPEMNGHWSSSCAYNANGTLRRSSNSTAWFRKAFARIAIITRGGTEADIDAALARLHLPGIKQDLPVTTPKLQIVWNPQGFGSPDLPKNSANSYYPGDRYVDVVADDLYDMPGHGATWAAAQKLYDSHPSKPFGFGEWGLWGIDDPSFVRAMGAFARNHRRLVLLAYFNSSRGSTWDLHTKPNSAAAYRKYISPLG